MFGCLRPKGLPNLSLDEVLVEIFVHVEKGLPEYQGLLQKVIMIFGAGDEQRRWYVITR